MENNDDDAGDGVDVADVDYVDDDDADLETLFSCFVVTDYLIGLNRRQSEKEMKKTTPNAPIDSISF